VYDVRIALRDMAGRVRDCRTGEGLTLQQLATRCGVAASTIHKIEAQQMVPTVSVLMKIARGLGRRPEELVRDRVDEADGAGAGAGANGQDREREAKDANDAERAIGAWRIDHGSDVRKTDLPLAAGQRAILLFERGRGALVSAARRTRVRAGECIEVEGEPCELSSEPGESLGGLVIATPAGRLAEVLGDPAASGGERVAAALGRSRATRPKSGIPQSRP